MAGNDVLISCSNQDFTFAEQLAGDLQMLGFNATVHRNGAFHDVNQQRLVLVISPAALEQDAWHTAYETFVKHGRPICAARLDMAAIPPMIDRHEWVDFSLGYQLGINGIKSVLMTEHTLPKNPFKERPLAQIPAPEPTNSRQLLWVIGIASFVLIVGLLVVFFLLHNL
ncbi:MAG: toll/interleukin-1 receptor domain-containing protein [Anaerolineales bacterium]|nr:toll/interleukin-1 receptor domain-containing protein [Anaerolineales bacterium]